MNYLLLANPKRWDEYNPNYFYKYKTITYKMHKNNAEVMRLAKVGERALLVITGKEQVIKFEAVVSKELYNDGPDKVVEFSFVKEIDPIKVNALRSHPKIRDQIFNIYGGFKQNSVFAIEEYYIDRILHQKELESAYLYESNKQRKKEMSRDFFEKALRKTNHNTIIYPHLHLQDDYSNGNIISLSSIKQLRTKNNDQDNEEDIHLIKEILKKHEIQTELEGINIEIIAYYKSYHENGDGYGIYFNVEKFASYINSTYELLNYHNYNLKLKDVRDLCFEKVLQHERFHYLTELFITLEELASNKAYLYDSYRNTYRNTFATDKCFAEALANYFAKMYFVNKGNKKNVIDMLNIMFRAQMPGYRLAADIDEDNQIDMFNKFEDQLGIYRGYRVNDSSAMFKEFSQIYLKELMPLAKIEIGRKLNVPIYLINEGMQRDDFKMLINIIFPNLNKL